MEMCAVLKKLLSGKIYRELEVLTFARLAQLSWRREAGSIARWSGVLASMGAFTRQMRHSTWLGGKLSLSPQHIQV